MLWQIVLNALASGATILLLGLAASYWFAVSRFISFSIALTYVLGGYIAWAMRGAPVVGVLLAVSVSGLAGAVCEWSVFRPLRSRSSSALVLMLASLGLYAFGQNAISVVVGDDIKSVASASLAGSISIGSGRLSSVQVLIMAVAILTAGCVWCFERRSASGVQVRALVCDAELATAVGIPVQGICLGMAFGTAGLSGLAGALAGWDIGLTPTMGMPAFMTCAAAVLIGGVGSAKGVLLGSLLVSISQQAAVWVLGSQWQQAVVFAVLFAVLLLRPRGFAAVR